jgi:hypothetical protein
LWRKLEDRNGKGEERQFWRMQGDWSEVKRGRYLGFLGILGDRKLGCSLSFFSAAPVFKPSRNF